MYQKILIGLTALLLITIPIGITTGDDGSYLSHSPIEYGNIPFIENIGQYNEKIMFLCDTPYGKMAICKDSILHFLQSEEPEKGVATLDVIEMTFSGSSSLPIGIDDPGAEYNYILGSDPTLWRTGARGFFEILYPEIWDGIDLAFIATERGPKYEFRVGPGADPSLISMIVQGGDLIGSGSHVTVKTANSQLIDRDLINGVTSIAL